MAKSRNKPCPFKEISFREMHPITDIIYLHGTWEEFENEFEEGWGGTPKCPTLRHHTEHYIVASLVAKVLSRTYEDYMAWLRAIPNWHVDRKRYDAMMGRAYQLYYAIAQQLFPHSRVYFGNWLDREDFFRDEYIENRRIKAAEHLLQSQLNQWASEHVIPSDKSVTHWICDENAFYNTMLPAVYHKLTRQ